MSDNRKQDLILYSYLYQRLSTKDGFYSCFYCGNMASEEDHVPPLSRVNDYKSYRLKHEIYLLVPACKECNSFLSNSLQENLESRIEAAKDLLARKYSKLFRSIWTEDRLNEEGIEGNLRSYLLKTSKDQVILLDRLNYYEGLKRYRDYLLERF